MSNTRRPQRRDAHGAPVRTTREIQIAVATVLAVLAATVILVVIFRTRPISTSPTVSTPPSSAPAKGKGKVTTSSTAPTSTTSAPVSSSTRAPTSSTSAP